MPKPTELKHSDHLGWGRKTRFLDRDRSELTAYDLYNYVEDSYYPDVRELGYFIPRFCEIMANGESTHNFGWVCSLICLALSRAPEPATRHPMIAYRLRKGDLGEALGG